MKNKSKYLKYILTIIMLNILLINNVFSTEKQNVVEDEQKISEETIKKVHPQTTELAKEILFIFLQNEDFHKSFKKFKIFAGNSLSTENEQNKLKTIDELLQEVNVIKNLYETNKTTLFDLVKKKFPECFKNIRLNKTNFDLTENVHKNITTILNHLNKVKSENPVKMLEAPTESLTQLQTNIPVDKKITEKQATLDSKTENKINDIAQPELLKDSQEKSKQLQTNPFLNKKTNREIKTYDFQDDKTNSQDDKKEKKIHKDFDFIFSEPENFKKKFDIFKSNIDKAILKIEDSSKKSEKINLLLSRINFIFNINIDDKKIFLEKTIYKRKILIEEEQNLINILNIQIEDTLKYILSIIEENKTPITTKIEKPNNIIDFINNMNLKKGEEYKGLSFVFLEPESFAKELIIFNKKIKIILSNPDEEQIKININKIFYTIDQFLFLNNRKKKFYDYINELKLKNIQLNFSNTEAIEYIDTQIKVVFDYVANVINENKICITDFITNYKEVNEDLLLSYRNKMCNQLSLKEEERIKNKQIKKPLRSSSVSKVNENKQDFESVNFNTTEKPIQDKVLIDTPQKMRKNKTAKNLTIENDSFETRSVIHISDTIVKAIKEEDYDEFSEKIINQNDELSGLLNQDDKIQNDIEGISKQGSFESGLSKELNTKLSPKNGQQKGTLKHSNFQNLDESLQKILEQPKDKTPDNRELIQSQAQNNENDVNKSMNTSQQVQSVISTENVGTSPIINEGRPAETGAIVFLENSGNVSPMENEEENPDPFDNTNECNNINDPEKIKFLSSFKIFFNSYHIMHNDLKYFVKNINDNNLFNIELYPNLYLNISNNTVASDLFITPNITLSFIQYLLFGNFKYVINTNRILNMSFGYSYSFYVNKYKYNPNSLNDILIKNHRFSANNIFMGFFVTELLNTNNQIKYGLIFQNIFIETSKIFKIDTKHSNKLYDYILFANMQNVFNITPNFDYLLNTKLYYHIIDAGYMKKILAEQSQGILLINRFKNYFEIDIDNILKYKFYALNNFNFNTLVGFNINLIYSKNSIVMKKNLKDENKSFINDVSLLFGFNIDSNDYYLSFLNSKYNMDFNTILKYNIEYKEAVLMINLNVHF